MAVLARPTDYSHPRGRPDSDRHPTHFAPARTIDRPLSSRSAAAQQPLSSRSAAAQQPLSSRSAADDRPLSSRSAAAQQPLSSRSAAQWART